IAYDAVENLVSAYGYYLDDSREKLPALFSKMPDLHSLPDTDAENALIIHQSVQPVINVAPDGKSATIRARLLNVGGKIGGFTAGTYEGIAVNGGGVWKLQSLSLKQTWSSAFNQWTPEIERRR